MKQLQHRLQFQLQHLSQKVNSWPLTKRLALLLLSCVLLFAGYYYVILSPVLLSVKKLDTQIKSIETTTRKLQESIFTMISSQQKAEESTKAQIADAQKKIGEFDIAIQNNLGKLQTLPSLLSALQSTIDQQSGITLTYIRKLGEKPLLSTTNATGDVSKAILSQQNIEIAFQGNYFATLSYLQKLESMKLPIVWDSLSYQVVTYPNANISLSIGAITMKASP
jgi:MSHA biogenesis protein MshJ